MSESGFKLKPALTRGLIVVALCLLAVGCRTFRGNCNAPGAHADAQTASPLKIPPGLEAPDITQALRVPELNTPEPPPRSKGDPCLDAPPPYATPKPAQTPAT